MNILNFKQDTIASLTMSRIEELADNRKPVTISSSMVSFFVNKVKESGIFKECRKLYSLDQSETALEEFIGEIPVSSVLTVSEYENYIGKLRTFLLNIQGSNSYWQPVFYTIASLFLCYCLYDLEVLTPETRDANLDKLARRQTLGQLFETLKKMNDSQSKRMHVSFLSVIKKGERTICEETFCRTKYYYIDLQGKEYSNHNTAADRDSKAASYVDELCKGYQNTDMYLYIKVVLSKQMDYRVF